MKSEHEDAQLPWLSLSQRVQMLEKTVVQLRRRLADQAHQPRPVQQPVSVMIGAMSRSGLAVAARHAEVIGFAGLRQVTGAPAGTFTLASAAETAERVEQVRHQARGRAYRSDVLLQAVVVDPHWEQAATQMAASLPDLTVKQVLDSPFVLFAPTAEQGAEQLRQRQQVYGFDSITTHQPHLEALGELIAASRGITT
jgi:hypothetical protein